MHGLEFPHDLGRGMRSGLFGVELPQAAIYGGFRLLKTCICFEPAQQIKPINIASSQPGLALQDLRLEGQGQPEVRRRLNSLAEELTRRDPDDSETRAVQNHCLANDTIAPLKAALPKLVAENCRGECLNGIVLGAQYAPRCCIHS